MHTRLTGTLYDVVDPPHASRDKAMMAEVRILTRLQAKSRRLKGEVREVTRQIKVTKQNLKRLLATPDVPWNEQTPPSRVFGEQE